MLGLGRLTAAIARLAGSLESLAGTAEEANTGIRQRLMLDGPGPEVVVPSQALEHRESEPEPVPNEVSARGGSRRGKATV